VKGCKNVGRMLEEKGKNLHLLGKLLDAGCWKKKVRIYIY
jgi:hypothetical protein